MTGRRSQQPVGPHAVMRGAVNAETAVDIVSDLCGSRDVAVERALYYPYFRFDCQCSLPTLFGRKASTITCLVDAVSGKGVTADAFEVDRLPLPQAERVCNNIAAAEAHRAAERTVSHALGKKLRVIADFRLRLYAAGLTYKGFWIVGSGPLRAMVDSVTGSLHPLTSNTVCTDAGNDCLQGRYSPQTSGIRK